LRRSNWVRARRRDPWAPADPNTFIVFREAVEFTSRGLMSADGMHYNQAGYNEMGLIGAENIAARERQQ
jgi:hypothetical protein